MYDLNKIIMYLNDYLRIKDLKDYSKNGLQIEGDEKNIKIIAFGVDATVDFFNEAKKINAELCIVHHGILWNSIDKIDKVMKGRLINLFNSNLSLYGVHLPLDKHYEVGNNAQLIKLLDFDICGEFSDIGYKGKTENPMPFLSLVKKVQEKLDTKVVYLNFGKEEVSTIGVVSGGGASYLEYANNNPIDVFITGEPLHYVYHYAKELKINVIYAGHYKTETVGIIALMNKVKEQFPNLNTQFIDLPTGF